jgi:hypothetical protein
VTSPIAEPLSVRAQNEPVSGAEEPAFGVGAYVVRPRWRRLAGRRQVVFAVHAGGVYFGSGRPPETVPWDVIRAVELFLETENHLGSSATVHRCIGVRATGTRQVQRPGCGPAAGPQTPQVAQYYRDAGRPEFVDGADGTVRYAYRRMSGWRVSRADLAAAVWRFAPDVAVITGTDYPPPLTMSDATTAYRRRRGGRGWQDRRDGRKPRGQDGR